MGTVSEGQIRGDEPPRRGLRGARIQRLDCRHLDAVLDIAEHSFDRVWGRQDYAYFLAHDHGYCAGAFQDSAEGPELVAYFLGLLVQGDMDVISIATAPRYRRTGLGTRLMQVACGLPTVRRVFLEVAVENEGAIALYEKLGFAVTGVRRGYYENKRDALIMMRVSP